MNVRDLIPWARSNGPTMFRDGDRDPFLSLHREVNRLFDDAFRGFEHRMPGIGSTMGSTMGSALHGGWPSIDITETDTELRVTAEVPGLDEKDMEVLLQDGVLTLRGEKKAETEDKERHFSECFYGRFERSIPLGYEVEEDKVDAHFKNGVLTVTLPKSAKAQSSVKRITINH